MSFQPLTPRNTPASTAVVEVVKPLTEATAQVVSDVQDLRRQGAADLRRQFVSVESKTAEPSVTQNPQVATVTAPAPETKSKIELLPQAELERRSREIHESRAGMVGWSDKERILKALDNLGPGQGKQLEDFFKAQYGKELVPFLKAELDKSSWTNMYSGNWSYKEYYHQAMGRLKDFNPDRVAQGLHDALHGVGSDRGAVLALVRDLKPEQAQQVRESFKRLPDNTENYDVLTDYVDTAWAFSRSDVEMIRTKFNGPQPVETASRIHEVARYSNAFDDPDAIIGMIQAYEGKGLEDLKDAYAAKTGGVAIHEDLYQQIPWRAIDDQKYVDIAVSLDSENKEAVAEAGKIFLAMHGLSASAAPIEQVLADKSPEQRMVIERAFNKYYAHAWGAGSDLRSVLRSEISDGYLHPMLAVLNEGRSLLAEDRTSRSLSAPPPASTIAQKSQPAAPAQESPGIAPASPAAGQPAGTAPTEAQPVAPASAPQFKVASVSAGAPGAAEPVSERPAAAASFTRVAQTQAPATDITQTALVTEPEVTSSPAEAPTVGVDEVKFSPEGLMAGLDTAEQLSPALELKRDLAIYASLYKEIGSGAGDRFGELKDFIESLPSQRRIEIFNKAVEWKPGSVEELSEDQKNAQRGMHIDMLRALIPQQDFSLASMRVELLDQGTYASQLESLRSQANSRVLTLRTSQPAQLDASQSDLKQAV